MIDPSGNNAEWPYKYFVTGSAATTTSASLANITGLVSQTLAPSTKYEVEFILDLLTSADSNGIKIAVSCGGSGTAGVVTMAGYFTGSTAINTVGVTMAAVDTATSPFMTLSGQTGVAMLKGFVTTRSTGATTISVQFAKPTSGTATCNVGSVLKIKLAGT